MPSLTEVYIRSIKSMGAVKRYADAGGLYLEVQVSGAKLWRLKYRFAGKESRLSFGAWPEVSLKEARSKRDKAKKMLSEGIDPRGSFGVRWKKKDGEHCAGKASGLSFEKVAREWIEGRIKVWSQRHTETVVDRLVANVYPKIGEASIADITPVDVLTVVKEIEARGAQEVAKRVLGICSMIFRYAVAMQLIPSDPCRDLAGALAPRIKSSFAALTSKEDVGILMQRIDDYHGTAVVRAALVFSALTFCRPGTIRQAEWSEIDFPGKQWIIPASKMKLTKEMKLRKDPHIVPLARQALDLLLRVQHFTGKSRYIFPNPRKNFLPLSDGAVNAALKGMGYSGSMTAHGFRSMASTLLNEAGYRHDVIEAQLAHTSADKIRAIYNRAQYMEDRRQLMQAWADMLDSLKSGFAVKDGQRKL